MKKIIATVVFLVSTLVGCDDAYSIDEQGRPIAEQKYVETPVSNEDKNRYVLVLKPYTPVILRYAMFDGHEYVIATYDRGVGITHSPKCSCRK